MNTYKNRKTNIKTYVAYNYKTINMKLDCVLTAVNENPLYLEFIPIFIKTWNKLYPGIDVKILLHLPKRKMRQDYLFFIYLKANL